MEEIKECSYCGKEITNSYLMCLDNFLQAKYFDTEDDNIFCCKECFCNYVQLEEIEEEED